MPKKEERQLMRQKINISDILIESWKSNYLHDIRHMIHPSLMKEEDLGTIFEHQGRTFEILGMSIGGSIMLRETREEGVFYWECTRQFVQLKLERYNREFFKINGKLMTRDIPYPEIKLYLAPLNRKLKKEELVDDGYTDENEDELMETEIQYVEDDYDNESED
jgi:hypothetical protein